MPAERPARLAPGWVPLGLHQRLVVKKLLSRLAGAASRSAAPRPAPGGDEDAAFFSTCFEDRDDDDGVAIAWADRAAAIGAQPVDPARGTALFHAVWSADHHALELTADEIDHLATRFVFVSVPAAQDVIRQDERGAYLLWVLDGTLAVERIQPWGGRARLAETHKGDVLGEMALLDAGGRFSTCATLKPCILAVLEAPALDEMMHSEPRLAVALLSTLARRLSLRLRQVSARLSALLAGS